jgi:hypothetical protein
MFIAINKCWGGFSLSPKAVKRLAELNGKECYFFLQDYQINKHQLITLEEAEKCFITLAYSVPNPDDFPDNEEYYLTNRPTDRERADPKLIQVIEELGDEASGSRAHLRIVEIPDDVDWEIHDYDGMESVREKSREWY